MANTQQISNATQLRAIVKTVAEMERRNTQLERQVVRLQTRNDALQERLANAIAARKAAPKSAPVKGKEVAATTAPKGRKGKKAVEFLV